MAPIFTIKSPVRNQCLLQESENTTAVNGGTIFPFCGLEFRHVHSWGIVRTEVDTETDRKNRDI